MCTEPPPLGPGPTQGPARGPISCADVIVATSGLEPTTFQAAMLQAATQKNPHLETVLTDDILPGFNHRAVC